MAVTLDSWRGGGTGTGPYILQPATASQIPLSLDLVSGQTAVGFRVRNSAGTTLFSVDGSGNLVIAGSVSAVISETITGNVSISGNLSVTGTSTLTGAVTMSTSLSVTGTGYFSGVITANSNINVNNSLTVAGQTYFLTSAYVREVYYLARANPAAVTSYGGVFAKTAAGIAELNFIDSSGNVTQLTSAGAAPYLAGGTDVVLADGGTSASLTASNGGIFYSTASAGAILAGTATAGQMLQSGASAAPTWSTSTYPTSNAISTLLYASSANVMAALATANNGVLITSGTGVPSISSTLPSATQDNITRLGTIAAGVWNGTAVVVTYGGTGIATTTAYSVICAGTTATGAFQSLSALGTAAQVLTSNGAGALPTWQDAGASGLTSPQVLARTMGS